MNQQVYTIELPFDEKDPDPANPEVQAKFIKACEGLGIAIGENTPWEVTEDSDGCVFSLSVLAFTNSDLLEFADIAVRRGLDIAVDAIRRVADATDLDHYDILSDLAAALAIYEMPSAAT